MDINNRHLYEGIIMIDLSIHQIYVNATSLMYGYSNIISNSRNNMVKLNKISFQEVDAEWFYEQIVQLKMFKV